jgi:hypothetical protein
MGTVNAMGSQNYSFTNLVNLSGIKSYETVGVQKPASILLNITNAFNYSIFNKCE